MNLQLWKLSDQTLDHSECCVQCKEIDPTYATQSWAASITGLNLGTNSLTYKIFTPQSVLSNVVHFSL